MSLISMACFDTIENGRTQYTKKTLKSIISTVDLKKHRLFIVNNNSCEETNEFIGKYTEHAKINDLNIYHIHNTENHGTAYAINQAWCQRKPGEHCIKIDNDIIVNDCTTWVEQLEEVVRRDPKIGQVGLKRKDCSESVYNENTFYKSILYQLPHLPGERWVVVEKQFHVMGSCVLHSSRLLDAIGGLYQIGIYGFDDSFMSARSIKAGLMPVMLSHIDIDHIDDGSNVYQKEKEKLAGMLFDNGDYLRTLQQIDSGEYYYDGIKLRKP